MKRPNPAYLLVLPALSAITAFFVIPVATAWLLSVTDFDIYGLADPRNVRFVGLTNYARLLDEPLFWVALRNTAYFVIAAGPLGVAISLATALLVNARAVRFKGFFRAALFVPVVTTLVAVAIVWRYIYHPRFGLLNAGLAALGIAPVDWLGDPRWAMPAIALLAVWKNFGFNMVIFLAGLQSIPERLYEAARIDGATWWQQLRYVTIPSLRSTLVFVVVTTAIGYLQLFAEPYVMTQGGPGNSTLSLVLFMYEEGFRWWNLGYATAIAFILFTIILGLTLGGPAIRRVATSTAPSSAT